MEKKFTSVVDLQENINSSFQQPSFTFDDSPPIRNERQPQISQEQIPRSYAPQMPSLTRQDNFQNYGPIHHPPHPTQNVQNLNYPLFADQQSSIAPRVVPDNNLQISRSIQPVDPSGEN